MIKPNKLKATCTNAECPERKSICCGASSESTTRETGFFICSKCTKVFIGEKCNADNKPKVEFDDGVLCKCGKPAPIMPHYCEKCGRGSMGKKKLKVVGAVIPKQNKPEWEDEFVELYGYLDKYVRGIVGRQGKWIAHLMQEQYDEFMKVLEEAEKRNFKAGIEKGIDEIDLEQGEFHTSKPIDERFDAGYDKAVADLDKVKKLKKKKYGIE